MSEKSQRMVSQDIAKGIAILLVVLLHIIEVPQIIRIICGLLFGYAMPFFLFMTGFNYKNKGLTPAQNIKKRLIQILRPFFVYTFLLGIIMSIHFVLNGEATVGECIKSYAGFLLSRWGTPYIGWDLPKTLFQRVYGPLWFIQFLVPATIVFYPFVDKALENKKNFLITIFGLATVSCVLIELGLVLPWGIQDAPAIAAIMIIGAWCHQDNRLFKEPSKKKWTYINCFVCIATIGVIELTGNTAGYFPAGDISGVYGGVEVYITMLVALFGSYFLINFSKLLEKVKVVSNVYSWLGRHSLQILILHLPFAHLVIDAFGYQQMITEFPVASETISIDQVISFVVTMAVLYIVITLIDKSKAKKKA